MDIRNWPMDRIMQLPDCCFGRRWPFSIVRGGSVPSTLFDISEMALPDRCVIWKISMRQTSSVVVVGTVELRLGDKLPANDAEFDAMEMLLPGMVNFAGLRSVIEETGYKYSGSLDLRMMVLAQGRRVVGRFTGAGEGSFTTNVWIVVSSIPTEVPDWLISGPGRSL